MILLLPFGSQVYGLTTDLSDRDYLALCLDEPKPEYLDTGYGKAEIESWDADDFKRKLQEHDIKALEIFFENETLLSGLGFTFNLNKSKLRRSVSAVCSNAHVKAKKKIRDGELYIGLKSYWHVYRILFMFNILAETSTFKPSAYKEGLTDVYEKIMSYRTAKDTSTIFKSLEDEYKVSLKALQHKFRLQCPLED